MLDLSKSEDVNLMVKKVEEGRLPLSLLEEVASKMKLSMANHEIDFGGLEVFVDNPSLVANFQYSLGNKNFYFNYGFVAGRILVIF